jgi:SAM-dependent methyltransferase
MIKIDLGAGQLSSNKIDRYKRYLGDNYNPSDYIGVDIQKNKGVNKVCDFENEKLPFGENSVDEIVTIHTLEHIHNLEHVIKECHRILKPNSSLKVWVPHCHSTVAFSEPFHVRFFAVSTFDNYDVKGRNSENQNLRIFFEKVSTKLQVCRCLYKVRWYDNLLAKLLSKKLLRGERFLKILPYKEWEVCFELKKANPIVLSKVNSLLKEPSF